jgi:hypothetical protein
VTARARRVLAALAVAAAAVVLLPGPSAAQVFFASRPHPEFSVGPLFVRAAVTPALGATTVDVLFSLVVPPRQSGADLEQDIYLLWPGGVRGTPGERDPALGRFAESRGFEVVASGTVPLVARILYAPRGQ